MGERLDEFDGATVSVVFFDATDRLGDYRRHHGVPDAIRLVADPERRVYDAFGIDRGSWWRVWGPRTIRAYARLLGRGRRYHRHEGDSLQLGGDVVVGADGRVVEVFRPPDPDARPSVDELLAALARA